MGVALYLTRGGLRLTSNMHDRVRIIHGYQLSPSPLVMMKSNACVGINRAVTNVQTRTNPTLSTLRPTETQANLTDHSWWIQYTTGSHCLVG